MSRLGNYLRRRVATQTLALLGVLTATMQVLELLDVTTDVLDRKLGLAGVAHYAMLRLPGELIVALPLAALLGAMTAFHAMARNHEITALRSAGVSVKRIVWHLLPVPLLFALLQFGLSQSLVPLAETELKAWWDASAPSDNGPIDPRWVHTSAGLVSIDRSSADGRLLQGLRMYQRDAEGLLELRTSARAAEWKDGRWALQDIRELRIARDGTQRTNDAPRNWQTNLRPDDVMRLDLAQPRLSSMMLIDVIAGERVGGQPLSYYRTVLLRSFTAPLAMFIMLLLAVPPATALERGSSGGGRLLVALALGLGFLLFDGVMSALGTSDRVPALAAALAAPLLFTAIGLIQLHNCDRT